MGTLRFGHPAGYPVLSSADAEITTIWIQTDKREHHGYSNTDRLLHVVHHHKRSPVAPLDHAVLIGTGSGVPYAEQMVSHSPGNIQRRHLFVSRPVQNLLSCL